MPRRSGVELARELTALRASPACPDRIRERLSGELRRDKDPNLRLAQQTMPTNFAGRHDQLLLQANQRMAA